MVAKQVRRHALIVASPTGAVRLLGLADLKVTLSGTTFTLAKAEPEEDDQGDDDQGDDGDGGD